MSNMSIFGGIIWFLFLYSISIINVPIGIIGGIVLWVKFVLETDVKKAQRLKYMSNVLFRSAIPIIGPCLAFNYKPKEVTNE